MIGVGEGRYLVVGILSGNANPVGKLSDLGDGGREGAGGRARGKASEGLFERREARSGA